MRKLIDLPDETIAKLKSEAKKKRMLVKPFMELVLINYAKKIK